MRMTWEEIVKAYPKQYVVLEDVCPDIYKPKEYIENERFFNNEERIKHYGIVWY